MRSTRLFSIRSLLALVVFLVVVIGVGGLIGTLTAPGVWYEGLNKPFFNPPNTIFAPVWTVLYVAIALAGWRVWTIAAHSIAMKLWVAQLVLNWIWPPTFFTFQFLWPAFVVISAVLLTIIAFMVTVRHYDRASVWLFLPYLLWVGFATLLNGSIAYLN